MNDTLSADPLLWEALPDLTLNIAQTAALCGITVRQLGYWTQQGYVSASGQGARRAYGLEAIRRVLAIRKSMEAGASLRQSLRLASNSSLPAGTSVTPAARALPSLSLVSQSLAAFFAVNASTRDHAGGLAVKLGWAEADVRQAADSLCDAGQLDHSVCQGIIVFHRKEEGTAHA